MTEVEPPSDLGEAGRALWSDLAGRYDLDGHEVTLLLQACRTVDSLERLQSEVADGPVVVETPQGVRVHPALPELRAQRIALARLLSALRIPDEGSGNGGRRLQRRGPRGVYGLGGVA